MEQNSRFKPDKNRGTQKDMEMTKPTTLLGTKEKTREHKTKNTQVTRNIQK
jgi:hypothetical protein